MDFSNQPIVTPSQPEPTPVVVSPEESLPRELPDFSPGPESAPAVQRRDVSNFGSDVISSMQSLLGTIVIAIFVITFIVLAISKIMLLRLEKGEGAK